MMISEDPWQLIGTVQCLVSVASPIGDDQLHEVKSASVHILARGRLILETMHIIHVIHCVLLG